MRPSTHKNVCTLLVILSLCGCGQQKQVEDYEMSTSADLTLKASNHPHGYGKSDCFVCHTPSNIHQVNHLKHASFDIAQTLVKKSGLASCKGCHGANGL